MTGFLRKAFVFIVLQPKITLQLNQFPPTNKSRMYQTSNKNLIFHIQLMLILIIAGANSLLGQQVASVDDADIAVTAQ